MTVQYYETKEQLAEILKEIQIWEKDQKKVWFWEKIGQVPFLILDKLTPAFIHKKIGKALDELGHYVQSGGRYLIRKETILKRLQKNEQKIESVHDVSRLPLSVMTETAEEIIISRKTAAAFQGATTGFGGLFTLAIDVPAVLGLSLKILQEIALCYGYDPNEKEERIFIVKCLQLASADIVGKKAIMEELENYNSGKENLKTASRIQGWREVITSYRDNMGWKKLFQLVPIAGMIFGAYLNRSTVQDVAEAGLMLYKKRRVLDRLKHYEDNTI
ncbi:EcsC family protein [Bacillus taeanensis]|uniref:EcsC family protein n=1 Tax=Bacillus taeanensis TaxID=273032 RepID=A0A366XSC8_9BACI|nr:EcsC family protein [Bacillus taeanensis]RBW68045.1 EcsC family protein [Bacillus taeanensis]